MLGKISFQESLRKRLKLFEIKKDDIALLIDLLKDNVTSSIQCNKGFILNNSDDIYIISGGFKDYIWPVVSSFGIKKENIFANTFYYNKSNKVTGYDESNFLSMKKGKYLQMKSMNIKEDVWVIGDGYSDYEIKEGGLATKFFLFTENVFRDSLKDKADYILNNFQEFIDIY